MFSQRRKLHLTFPPDLGGMPSQIFDQRLPRMLLCRRKPPTITTKNVRLHFGFQMFDIIFTREELALVSSRLSLILTWRRLFPLGTYLGDWLWSDLILTHAGTDVFSFTTFSLAIRWHGVKWMVLVLMSRYRCTSWWQTLAVSIFQTIWDVYIE